MTQKQAKKELILHQCCVCWEDIPYPKDEEYPLRCDTCESGYLCRRCQCKVKVECPLCRSLLPTTSTSISDKEYAPLRLKADQGLLNHSYIILGHWKLGKRGVNFKGGEIRGHDQIQTMYFDCKRNTDNKGYRISYFERVQMPFGQQTHKGGKTLYEYNIGTRKFQQYAADGKTIDYETDY